MPVPAATTELVAVIASLPPGLTARAAPERIAERLISLLPPVAPAAASDRAPPAERPGIHTVSHPVRVDVGVLHTLMLGIPFPIVECVAFQFHASEVGAGDCEFIAVVHAADALSGIITCGEPEEQAAARPRRPMDLVSG